MKSTVKSVEKYIPLALMNVPLGQYPGKWSGYEVLTIINGEQYKFKTENGIRGMNIDCVVIVNDKGIVIEI